MLTAGGIEMARGNMPQEDRPKVRRTVAAFTQMVVEECREAGIPPGQIPFARSANLLMVLDSKSLYLVIDNRAVGGVPDRAYLDARTNEGTPMSLQTAIGIAVSQLGFRSPYISATALPASALDASPEEREQLLRPWARDACRGLLEATRIERLNLPQGYQHYSRFFPAFLADHPDRERNVFLMMRFKSGPQYDLIASTLREQMARYGLKVLRADDKDYTGDLWENVVLYMLGSNYGVVVFEEIDIREFNPSVSLELGFMLAHSKRCLILKDQRMPSVPTDIVGKLYKGFDTYNIERTLTAAVESWARDLNLSEA